MMYKIINIDPYFNDTDELSVKLLDVGNFEKNAALLGHHVPEEIISFIKGLDPDPNYAYAHVIAMSADEYYGSNRNGDAFKEKDLLGNQDEIEASKNTPPYTNQKLPRYKTFLSAKFYKHHINKDPNNSYGHVVVSTYNMPMHRVELIIAVNRKKTPEFVSKLEAGKPVPLSMGCKVPYDVCSICLKKSKTRAEYCDHAKYNMNGILPDGRQVKVFNPKSRFFDISEVLIGADEQSFTLSKVASNGQSVDYSPYEYYEGDNYEMEKLMNAFKTGEINKRVPGTSIGDAVKNVNIKILSRISRHEPDFANKDLERASEHPLNDIFSTLANMGMVLKPGEHRKIIIIKISKNPDLLKESASLKVDLVNPSVYNTFKKYAESRSCYIDYLIKRASDLLKESEIPEFVTDPISDQLYDIYRRELNKLDADKIASNIENTYNLEGFFNKTALSAKELALFGGAPLAASYIAGAHKEYKRRYEGKPLGEFETMLAEKPGRVGALGALAGTLGRHFVKGYKVIKK